MGRSVKESSKDVLARSKLPIRRVSHAKEQTYRVFLLCSVTGWDQPLESVASWRGEGGFRVQHLGLPVDHAALCKNQEVHFRGHHNTVKKASMVITVELNLV